MVTTYTCDLKPMHVDASRVGAMTGLAIMNETEVIQEWRLYIVQEFCDGGSLRHAIEARSFLNPATGSPQLEWVLQVGFSSHTSQEFTYGQAASIGKQIALSQARQLAVLLDGKCGIPASGLLSWT